MRVLHLPTNIASQMSVTVRAQRDIGIEARGLTRNNSLIKGAEGIENFRVASLRQYPLRGMLQTLHWTYVVLRAIRWADVIHWYYGAPALQGYLGLRWARLLKKPGAVEFFGSDIRIAEVEAQDNPYYLAAREKGQYRLPDQLKRSRGRQQRFAEAGFECLIGSLLQPYIQPDIFPLSTVHFTRGRLHLDDFVPRYPSPESTRTIIAHSPSRPREKGTPAVLAAVDTLRREFDLEFRLITGVEHNQALQMVSECDIFIDQLISGTHGIAALEAMALGKPVICYIKPTAFDHYPENLPIVNANQEDLVQVLGGLLANGQRRHEIGRQSRTYVEQYHDAHQIARQLGAVYEQLIDSQGSKL